MKVLNPLHRKRAVTRQLHEFKGKFSSVLQVKEQILQELKDVISSSSPRLIEVGYYEGRQSMKVWLVSPKDVEAMYRKSKTDDIFLWVENIDEEDGSDAEPERKRKKTSDSRRQDKEEEVEGIYQELRSNHGDRYTIPQLRLWARMIQCGTYDDYNDPPRVPMITGNPSQHPKRNSLEEAITGAAEAIAKVFTPQPTQVTPASTSTPQPTQVTSASAAAVQMGSGTIGISPGKTTDLRMKNLQQLRLLHQLFEENVITEKELQEQKSLILDALRKL